jgi:hypothetical protein
MNEDFFTEVKSRAEVRLNDVQKQDVMYTKGALLLLASPGVPVKLPH